MKTTRRGFLGVIGGAVAGGRKGVETLASEVAGQVLPYGAINSARAVGNATDAFDNRVAFGSGPGPKTLDVDAFRAVGYIPDYVRRTWRRDVASVNVLDPDLAAMRSMSMSARLLIQRERDLARIEERFWEEGRDALARTAFEKAVGRPSWGWWA